MSEELDKLFGVHAVTFGDATFRVRRVLTREQERAIQAVAEASQKASLAVDEVKNSEETMASEDQDKLAEELDASVRAATLTALNDALLLDKLPALSELALSSLMLIFNACADAVARNTDTAVAEQTAGFPTTGA